MATTGQLDTADLTKRVKDMYQEVALHPEHEFHFETGRGLAEHLGYRAADLDRIPAAAIDSFAGVGYFMDLAAIERGDVVVDLGSGSGTDAFLAALAAGEEGQVIGIDMTDEQLAKSRRLAEEVGIANAEFRQGLIEEPPVETGSVDCVISNGVVNLAPDKAAVFAAAADWRSPTSSAPGNSRKGSPATPRCGRPASAGRCSATTTWRRSSAPASRSPRSARTATGSSPIAPPTPRRNTASPASPYWRIASKAVGQHS